MNHNKQQGFTIIELTFAMAALSILLISITMLVIQLANIYNKGVTLNVVDQAGQSIVKELQTNLAHANAGDVDFVQLGSDSARLCTGTVSYIWNYGSAILANDITAPKASKYTGNSSHDLRFVRIADTAKTYCIPDGSGNYPTVDSAQSTELLQGEDRNVVLHSFSFTSYDIDGGQTMYVMSMTVGTNDQNEFILGQTTCQPPTSGEQTFCAVNVMDFTARSGVNTGGLQ